MILIFFFLFYSQAYIFQLEPKTFFDVPYRKYDISHEELRNLYFLFLSQLNLY